jgi:hypothetical protein
MQILYLVLLLKIDCNSFIIKYFELLQKILFVKADICFIIAFLRFVNEALSLNFL